MSERKFHLVMSCRQWETMRGMIRSYLYRDNFTFRKYSDHMYVLEDGRGRVGEYIIRELKNRIQFGYLEETK
jgi:hypothetical protein